VSGFVALTLSTMMCSVLLKQEKKHGKFYMAVENGLNGIAEAYHRTLTWAMSARWAVGLLYLVTIAGMVWLGAGMKRELSPIEDRGMIFTIISAPEGSSLAYTEKYTQQMEQIGADFPEIDRVFVVSGNPTVERGIAIFRTLPWSERERSTLDIAQEMQPKLAAVPGVMAFANPPPSLGQSSRERPVSLMITTNASYEELQGMVQQIIAKAGENPGLTNLDSDLRLNKPQVNVMVDRDRAADAGVPVETVARTLETMLGGRNVT